MFPELSEIPRLRRESALTQARLAALSRVSQSTIAKVESGRTVPSYSIAKRIFEALVTAGKKMQKSAGELMNPRIISVARDEGIMVAVGVMKKNGISQLLVTGAHKHVVGSLTEKGILSMFETEEGLDPHKMTVSQAMEDAFPTVGLDTPLSTLTHILHDAPAIVVMRGERIAGIITKADILKAV
ncbi:MAG: CBS domain-containing protein [Candidatus Micrarchaeota archaeon]